MMDIERHMYGGVAWLTEDEHGMTTVHEIDGYGFQVQGFESSADEFEVRYDDRKNSTLHGVPIFHYVHTLGGRSIEVNGDVEPEVLVRAALALADRFTVSDEAVNG